MTHREKMESQSPPIPAPIEFAGQWVAWNKKRTEIIAHGKELQTVFMAAKEAGHPDAILQRVRSPQTSFIGAS